MYGVVDWDPSPGVVLPNKSRRNIDIYYSKICEYSDMLKQGGWFINPFFPIYKAIFYGYLHNKIMNRQVQQEEWWGLVQPCCLTGSDISQQKLSLSQTLKQLTYNWKAWILGKIWGRFSFNSTKFPFFSTVRNPQSSTLPGIKNIQVTWCFMSHCLGQNLETQILEEVSRWSSLKDTLIAMDVVGCWVYSSIFLYDNDMPITICRWEVSVKKWGSILKQSSGIYFSNQ